MEEKPRIEEFYLGEPNLEAYYTDTPCSAMAIQPDAPQAAKRARELEAYGYHRKPPLGGRRALFVDPQLDDLDEISIAATRRGVEMQATAGEMQEIKKSYRASEHGDALWIAFDTETHLHTVVAVLRILQERGELEEE